MEELQIGARIRGLRRQRHIAQADLAAAIGISGSYLNLIEHNRRKVTVPLLLKVAGYFGVEAGELAEGDETRLVGDLMEMFGDNALADADVTNHEVRDLAATNPGAARAMLRLYDKYKALAQGGAMTTEEGETEHFHLATDRISDFLQEHANYFPTIEAAAERIRADIDNASESFEFGLRTYIANAFGIEVRLAALPPGIARTFDRAQSRLLVSDILPTESGLFLVAHQLGQMAAAAEIEALVAELPEGDAPALARNVLGAYFAAALIMPYAPFQRACRDYRYDIERLGRRFGASFEQVCHRMTTLQRPGRSGVPLHLVRAMQKKRSPSGICETCTLMRSGLRKAV